MRVKIYQINSDRDSNKVKFCGYSSLQKYQGNSDIDSSIRPSVLDLAQQFHKMDNCESRSEFIEKAIIFYAGYVSSNKNDEYLPNIITSTLKSIVKESDNRISNAIFKIAVELAITMNLIASSQNVDKITLERLRGECVKEVRRLNGHFSIDDAFYWQKGND